MSLPPVSVYTSPCPQKGALTPRAHNVILGDGEDDVAVGVVFDLRKRALVAGEKDRPHGCGVCEVKVEGC